MSSKSDETATPATAPADTLVDPSTPSKEKAEGIKKPYSIYTTREKWLIVLIASFAGLFSPLTANIYLPAIPTMAAAFHKSTELINITVTVYMVFQGISPMLWGTIADKVGRRPIFLACLLVLSIACVGLALVPTNAYWLLVLLRCLQAAGSASTVALGAGVIGDIAEPFERGGFFGLFSLGPMVAIGPIIGGLLADNLGWRAIFWFLCIASAVCLLSMVLFLPETLRALVGDGSYIPSAIYRPLLPIIGRHRVAAEDVEKPPKKPFANPLLLFTYPDVIVILIFNGIVYSVFYGVTATISVLFKQAYPYLSESDIGLCFLAIGGGMVIGSATIGKLLDRDYASFKNKMVQKIEDGGGESGARAEDVTKDENFPIELARLRTMPVYLGIFCIATIGYGWCLQAKVSIAVPLVLHICMGFVLTAVMNTSQTLLVDLMPSQGSSVTACNNLVRCSLGAALVAVINIITDALKPGWTYVLLGGVCVLTAPLLYVSMRIGPECRAKRRNAKALVASQK
ncbi:MFS general substrate transporter [Athelia psychrophila]|uniref:MFS general substrate transporter n=1 Tax=Athelia psychrophila TaxID=1759441 RepID=A0A166NW21_9AGAM|nr:MFS general substrate transporter [Fibularhizoctonia sp. CBS 109695]